MSPTRRDFIRTSIIAGGAATLSINSCSRATLQQRHIRQLHILILGGTSFIGPHQVSRALERGHTITLFNRGRTNTHLFPEVEKLIGDRQDDLSALEGRTWDAVIDNSATNPSWVRRSARLLKDSVGTYLFTSTRSVTSDFSRLGMTALDAPVYSVDSWTEEDEAQMGYGLKKSMAEKEARQVFGNQALIIRPGLIVGPGDTTDRFTYWPVRLDRGGEVLAPGDPEGPVMFIDARDLGEWYIHLLEHEVTGTFMALGPEEPLTFSGLLEGIGKGVEAEATFTWVDTDFLLEQGVRPYSHMPLWQPARGRNVGFNRFNLSRILATGIKYRPLPVTAKDTLEYHKSRPEEHRSRLRAGITAEREAELLKAWHARGG